MPLMIKRVALSHHRATNAKHFLKAFLFIALLSALSAIKANASTYFDFRTSTGTAISNQGDGTLCSTGEIVCKYVVINLGRPAADISGIKYYQLNMAGFNIMGGGCGSGALDIAVYNDAAYTNFDHAFALDGSGASPSFFSANVNFSVPADKFAQLIFGCNDGGGTAITLIDGGPGTYVARDINSIRYTGLPNLCIGDTPADCGATINTTEKIFDFEDQSGSISTDFGNGPFNVSVRLGQPKISIGPGIFQVQFFQNGTGGCPDPGYSFQAFADSGYTIPIGTAFNLLTTADVAGNPIALGDYNGTVIATIFGAFDATKYYALGFASCDASRPISIRGDGSGNYVCTQMGGRFGLFCITAYYEGAFPYLIISPITSQAGTIIVTTNNPAATFTISDDDGNNFQGSGTSFVQAAPPGIYAITFGTIPGFNTPAPQTSTLSSGGVISFRGNYQLLIATPTSLRATVGSGAIALDWSSSQTPNVDGYNVYIEQFSENHFVSLGTVNALESPIPDTHFIVADQFSEGVITNGVLYRFRVTAVKNGFESLQSDPVLARPGQFALSQLPPPPQIPILFLHGICLPPFVEVSDGAKYWKDTVDFITRNLHWTDGGTLIYLSNMDPRNLPPVSPEHLDSSASFYTATFGNCKANYSVGRLGLLHQADEVQGFVHALNAAGVAQVNIVAHSMGGLAARSYIADNPEAAQKIVNFITYGSPHWGVPRLILSSILNPLEDGARDLTVDCRIDPLALTSTLDYGGSIFLEHLRQVALPNKQIRLVNIRGKTFFDALQAIDGDGCLSSNSDGPAPFLGVEIPHAIIPIDSADLVVPAHAPNNQPIIAQSRTLITTDRIHTSQPSDFSAILCALDANCSIYRTHSPVDIEITAPDGRAIMRDLAEIPGATYTEVSEDSGGTSATVLLPFPLGGTYLVKVVPKLGAASTDSYSLDVTRAGVTTILAENQSLQSAPIEPYAVPTLPPLAVYIKSHRRNQTELADNDKITVSILSTPEFDAPERVDPATLSFGHSGDEHSLASCKRRGEDINRDHLPDLMCRFVAKKTGLLVNDSVAILKGITKDGIPFVGMGTIHIVPEDETEH